MECVHRNFFCEQIEWVHHNSFFKFGRKKSTFSGRIFFLKNKFSLERTVFVVPPESRKLERTGAGVSVPKKQKNKKLGKNFSIFFGGGPIQTVRN